MLSRLSAVCFPPEVSMYEQNASIPLGALQKNTRLMPGNCQPLVRIGASCWPILPATQIELAGARDRRAQTQRRHRHVACKNAFPTAPGAGGTHQRDTRQEVVSQLS